MEPKDLLSIEILQRHRRIQIDGKTVAAKAGIEWALAEAKLILREVSDGRFSEVRGRVAWFEQEIERLRSELSVASEWHQVTSQRLGEAQRLISLFLGVGESRKSAGPPRPEAPLIVDILDAEAEPRPGAEGWELLPITEHSRAPVLRSKEPSLTVHVHGRTYFYHVPTQAKSGEARSWGDEVRELAGQHAGWKSRYAELSDKMDEYTSRLGITKEVVRLRNLGLLNDLGVQDASEKRRPEEVKKRRHPSPPADFWPRLALAVKAKRRYPEEVTSYPKLHRYMREVASGDEYHLVSVVGPDALGKCLKKGLAVIYEWDGGIPEEHHRFPAQWSLLASLHEDRQKQENE